MNATEVQLEHPYVDYHHGGYWVASTRVSLDSLVYQWRRKQSAEDVQYSFPVLTLAQVFGALAYYLDHQEEIDEYLKRVAVEEEEFARKARELYPDLHRKLDALIHTHIGRPNEDQVSSR